MKGLFTRDCLQITIKKDVETKHIILSIESEYSDSNHKGKLWVNEKRIAEYFEDFWKKIKTKKRLRMSAYFGEIDWYDDMTDMYETPTFSIGRGLKRAKISSHSHGSIPKDWTFNLTVVFDEMDRLAPVVDVLYSALGNHLTDSDKKEITKELKKFKEKGYARVYVGVDDDD